MPNTVNPSEKELIASYVVSHMIQEHDIIALDSGSTTLEIARQLDNIPLTILTNDLLIMREVMMKEHIKLIVPGGYSKHNLLIPSHPLEWLQEINIYKLFLSTSGIHPNYGLSIFSNEQLAMKKALIQAAQEVICVADHSKFGRGALHTFATIDQIQQFVTDAGIAASDIELMQQAGAQVCVANS
nr:DeoR/GlpR transcriptional regulator [Paenibacillus camelliae]